MHEPQQAGRPRRGVTGLLLVCGALVIVTVVALLVVLLGDETYRAAPPPEASAGPDRAGASVALRAFEDAASRQDGAAVARLAPPADADAQELLSGVGANVADLDLVDVTARYVDEAGAVAPDGSWPAEVELTWRLDGIDERVASSEVVVTFRPDDDRVALTSFEGGERTPLWLTGDLDVVRDGDVLVMVAGDADAREGQAQEWLARTRRAVPVVRRVLTAWRGPVVVEVPASAAQLDTALGAPSGTYAAIAAVTSTADGTVGPDAPVRVFANPEVTARLRQRGAQVVMNHELVHVATDAVSTVIEPWLLEGFADYVALRDVPLPLTTTASRAIALAERSGVPRQLPDAASLGTQAGDLEAAYELDWLACLVIAEEAGEQALVDLYDAVDSGEPLASSLRRETGLTLARLTARWQDRIKGLL